MLAGCPACTFKGAATSCFCVKKSCNSTKIPGAKTLSLLTSHVSIVGIKDLHILCLAFDTWALDLFQSFRKTCKIITHNQKLATGTSKERDTGTESIMCMRASRSQIHGQYHHA